MFPTREIAPNKWLSSSPIIAALAFCFELGGICISSWLLAWPVEFANLLIQANEVDDLGGEGFKTVQGKRLLAVCHLLNDTGQMRVLCLLNLALQPTDALLQFLVWADTPENKDVVRQPLLAELLDPINGPCGVAHRQLANMTRRSSDMFEMLTDWVEAEHIADQPAFWGTFAFKGLVLFVFQSEKHVQNTNVMV